MPDTLIRQPVELQFRRPPSVIPGFLKTLLDRRPGRLEEGLTCPRIEGTVERLAWTAASLRRYSQVCGFPASDALPLPFPHIAAAGLHMQMLLHPEFPVRLPGLIHVWHRIQNIVSLQGNDGLTISAWIDGHEDVDSGAQFCLHTELRQGGEPVWQEQTGFLARSARRGRPGRRPAEKPDGVEYDRVGHWRADADIGRRYARVSRDYNPIHLSARTARPFGFPAAIAHGMWSLARCVAELQSQTALDPGQVDVRFRRPVLLPAELVLEAGQGGAGQLAFRLIDGVSSAVYLEGKISG